MSTQAPERSYRIGDVAERVGVTTRTIRYYEELGLLGTASSRTKGAHRLYTEADIARLEELIRLRDLLGLTLEELVALAEAEEARAALRNQWAESATDNERARIVEAAIPLVERQLELVRARQQRLSEFADELSETAKKLKRLEQDHAALQDARGVDAERAGTTHAAIAAAFTSAAERIEGLAKKLTQPIAPAGNAPQG